jgi:hypothetical protein
MKFPMDDECNHNKQFMFVKNYNDHFDFVHNFVWTEFLLQILDNGLT